MLRYLIGVLFLVMIPSPLYAAMPIECYCVTYVRQIKPDLPHQDAKDFIPNSAPHVGAIAIYRYWSDDGWVYHVGYILAIGDDGGYWEYGSNIERCTPYVRYVKADRHLVGFNDA